MKTISHDEKSGSVLGPQGSLKRLFNAEEAKEMWLDITREEKEAPDTKDIGKKCVVCGGAIIEKWEQFELDMMMMRVGPGSRGPGRYIHYCQNCEILYK